MRSVGPLEIKARTTSSLPFGAVFQGLATPHPSVPCCPQLSCSLQSFLQFVELSSDAHTITTTNTHAQPPFPAGNTPGASCSLAARKLLISKLPIHFLIPPFCSQSHPHRPRLFAPVGPLQTGISSCPVSAAVPIRAVHVSLLDVICLFSARCLHGLS